MKKYIFKIICLSFMVIGTIFNVAKANTDQTPLTIVVPFPPGGDTDILARLFATEYSNITGRPAVIDNRPGAAGVIGFNYVSRANPNGSIIGLVPSTISSAPYFNGQAVRFDPKKDFVPIMQLTGHGMFVAVSSSTNIKTFSELISSLKSGRITSYGTPGVASPQNILGELFKKETKINITHVPFRGNMDVVNNMLSGTVPLTFNTLLPLIPQVDAGKINILAVASNRRSSFYPNVPTLDELGIKNIDFQSWLGFVGPKNMEESVALELNRVFNNILKIPSIQERLLKLGMLPVGSTPNQFKDRISDDSDKFLRISREIDIKVE